MKIFNKKKNGFKELKSIRLNLTIEELDNLIKFLSETKEDFIRRKEDASLSKIRQVDGEIIIEKLTKYEDIILLGNEIIDYHTHYKDYVDDNNGNSEFDIEIHTILKAIKKDDGTFKWVNLHISGK